MKDSYYKNCPKIIEFWACNDCTQPAKLTQPNLNPTINLSNKIYLCHNLWILLTLSA